MLKYKLSNSGIHSDIINLSYLNNGVVFPKLDQFYKKIPIKNLSKDGVKSIPIHFSEDLKIKKRNFKIFSALFSFTNNFISFLLLFSLKLIQKIINKLCIIISRYRIRMHYSDKKDIIDLL